ncbi:hypothetical protein MUK42_33208 [Musa troglodytarum]|uniref:Uncharacterized protein n=1 Tax=Musa troglodytarum TaxID=320322 RepID=A0A9E7FF52_9LILI|nr:hypothetical protein MUK42_33208 [Musa troglodytarum]
MGRESSKGSKDPKAPSFLLLSTTSSSSSSFSEDDEAAPIEELSDDSSASALPSKQNPFLFLAASTSLPSSCPSPWRHSGRLTRSFSPTLGSTRDDILLFFSSFLPSGASC